MSVIIRLQNLPWTANARDIRNFFAGLSIPEGGVHIIGGELGDAFIAFSTDEDARCAMLKDRTKLMEVQVRLLLSSRAEMQKVIETTRIQAEAAPTAINIATTTESSSLSTVTAGPGRQKEEPQQILDRLQNFWAKRNAASGNQAAETPTFLATYQQQAGITLSDYASNSRSPRQQRSSLSRSRSRSRSASSSSEYSDRSEREREREDRILSRKRRSERDRADSSERQLKMQLSLSSVSAVTSPAAVAASLPASRLLPWAAQVQATIGAGGVGGGVGGGSSANSDSAAAMLCLEQQAFASSSISSGTATMNSYKTIDMTVTMQQQQQQQQKNLNRDIGKIPGLGVSTPNNNLLPSALLDSKLVGASAQVPLAGAANEPIAFASVNPYSQIYPQLFQQQPPPNLAMQTQNNSISSSNNNKLASNLPGLGLGLGVGVNPGIGAAAAGIGVGGSSSSVGGVGVGVASVVGIGVGGSVSGSSGSLGSIGAPTAETCYIKILGMCPNTTYSDLRKYFAGLYIPHNGIKIFNGQNGARTSTAYIEFSRVSSAQKALARNNTQFRDYLVQILPISDEEFEQAEDRYRQASSHSHSNTQHSHNNNSSSNINNNNNKIMGGNIDVGSAPAGAMQIGGVVGGASGNVLHVEDLPQLTTEQDIMKMFSASYTVLDILLAPSPINRREFIAFVLFARESEALAALQDTSHHYLGFRKLRVRLSSLIEMENAKEKLRRASEQLLKEEERELQQKQQQQQQQQQQLQLQQQLSNGLSAVQAGQFQSDPRRRAGAENRERENEPAMLALNNGHVPAPFVANHSGNNLSPFAMNLNTNNAAAVANMLNLPFVANNSNNNNNNNSNNHGNVIQPFVAMPAMNNNNNNNNNNNHMNHNNNNNINNNNNMISPFAINNNNNINSNNNNNCNNNIGINDSPQSRRPDENNFVRVHNCEYGTRVNDLGELFMTGNLRIVHIELLYNERNMPAGEFIVEFGDAFDAKVAIREFHNRRFRGRGLRVVRITPQEIADRMNKPFMDYLPGGKGKRGEVQPAQQQSPQSRRRGPSRFDNAKNERNGNDGEGQQAPHHFNPFAVPLGENMPNTVLGNADVITAMNPPSAPSDGDKNNGIPDKFNRPGCVVAMRNVPFKADLKDILRFFNDYKLSPDDIIRRFNDNGKPTGDARVAFETPEEARSAFESRKRRQIFNRNVYLDII